ncbi:hypothetical protein DFH07DRAFT_979108 [Mycena maculata]|uniref:Uncharacterized protein n=1 Tax=Mycena maculata TaxID=230809 RepID=A0AAD7K2C2_9AGAR|nr:hypothetical protein DFH07DRAFT_979108 [Mycena maculata]
MIMVRPNLTTNHISHIPKGSDIVPPQLCRPCKHGAQNVGKPTHPHRTTWPQPAYPSGDRRHPNTKWSPPSQNAGNLGHRATSALRTGPSLGPPDVCILVLEIHEALQRARQRRCVRQSREERRGLLTTVGYRKRRYQRNPHGIDWVSECVFLHREEEANANLRELREKRTVPSASMSRSSKDAYREVILPGIRVPVSCVIKSEGLQ